jgi:hypothetical protein
MNLVILIGLFIAALITLAVRVKYSQTSKYPILIHLLDYITIVALFGTLDQLILGFNSTQGPLYSLDCALEQSTLLLVFMKLTLSAFAVPLFAAIVIKCVRVISKMSVVIETEEPGNIK